MATFMGRFITEKADFYISWIL